MLLNRLDFYAWAVQDGDIGAGSVPDPTTLSLMTLDAVGLGFRKKTQV